MRAAPLLAAGALLATTAAPAQAAWTPGVTDVQTIAATEAVHDIAVDGRGNGLAVWDAPAGSAA